MYTAPLNLQETPLTHAVNLSKRLGCEIWLKREDLHPVFSFKIRGAYNMMASLSSADKARGVVTCSAGNHAQGVALSGKALGIPATVVMPLSTPSIKVNNVRRLGGNVVLHGQDFDAAKAECLRLEKEKGLTFIPPYDDPYVVAGQGTIAMEICRQVADPDALDGVFGSIGGGGLCAGIAAYMKRVAPQTAVYGVETVDGDAMDKSLKAGHRVVLPEVGPFADGTAVRLVGEEPFRVCRELLDGVVIVDNDEICAAIKDVFEGECGRGWRPSQGRETPWPRPRFSVPYSLSFTIVSGTPADSRNTLDPRALRRTRARGPQGAHHPEQPARIRKAVRRGRVWRQHELLAPALRRGARRDR